MKETIKQREVRLARGRVRKRRERVNETEERYRVRLARDRIRKRQKRAGEMGEVSEAGFVNIRERDQREVIEIGEGCECCLIGENRCEHIVVRNGE